jgi:hypothetical protein
VSTNKSRRVGALVGGGRKPNVKFFFKEKALNGKGVVEVHKPRCVKQYFFPCLWHKELGSPNPLHG